MKTMVKSSSWITLLGVSLITVINFNLTRAQQQLFDNSAEIKFTTNKTKIYLAAFVLNVEKDTYTSRAAMEVARSLINKDSRILNDYELVIHYHNSLGNLPVVIRAFYQFMERGPIKQILLGPTFSQKNEKIIPFATELAVPQVSFSARQRLNPRRKVDGAFEPTPLEEKQYPFLVRTAPTFVQNNMVRVKLMKHFGWQRAAIVFDEHYTNFEKVEDLQDQLKTSNIDIVAKIRFDGDSNHQGFDFMFNKLKETSARIIVAVLGTDKEAHALMCQIYKRGLYGQKYVWLISESIRPTFHLTSVSDLEKNGNFCNGTELLTAMQNAIFMKAVYTRKDGVDSFSNISTSKILEQIKAEDRRNAIAYSTRYAFDPVNQNRAINPSATYAFDAVYTAALALDRLIEQKGNSALMTNRRDRKRALEIVRELFKSNFEGLSGSINFGGPSGDDNLGHVSVTQYRSIPSASIGFLQEVAYYNSEKGKLDIKDVPNTIFTDGIIRQDGIRIQRIEHRPSRQFLSAIWALVGASVVLAIVFLVINFKYRTVRLIKMSSPNMNSGILFGCFLLYLNLFLYGLDTRFISVAKLQSLCFVFPFLLSIGFTFLFGCLFSKTWRVYKIFTAAPKMIKVNTAALRDERLYILVLYLVVVDLFVCVIWVFVSPFELRNVVTDYRVINEDLSEEDFYRTCWCEYSTHFSITMFIYKGALLVLGSFLAWETREVRVTALNDSKYIGMALYNVFVVSVTTLIVFFSISSVDTYYYHGYLVVAVAILICSNVTISLVFIPKLTLLFGRNRTLERALSVQTFSFSTSTSSINNRVFHTNSVK